MDPRVAAVDSVVMRVPVTVRVLVRGAGMAVSMLVDKVHGEQKVVLSKHIVRRAVRGHGVIF